MQSLPFGSHDVSFGREETSFEKLANLYDNKGHVVGEMTVTPSRYAIQDGVLEFLNRPLSRLED